MKKFSTIFAIALVGALIVTTSVFALVQNGNFETGDFTSWTVSTFLNSNGFNGAPAAGGTDLSAVVGGPAVAPMSLSDPHTNGALQYPAYGHYTARVNSENSYTGGGFAKNANRISQNVAAYIDPADGQSHTRFTYAAVMVDPISNPHSDDQKPYFRVRAINTSNGNDVLYDFSSFVGEPGKNWQSGQVFSGSDTWKYLNWSYIDLTSSVAHPVNSGDIVTVEVTASGCTPGGHPGYVYVDEISDHEIAGPVVGATAPATVLNGGSITYTYNYHNGAAGLISPTITAAEPAGVTFTSVSDSLNCSLSGGTVTCNYLALPSGFSGTFTVTGTVTAPSGSVISNGGYDIAAAGFPTVGGRTTSTTVTGADVTINLAPGQADPTNASPVHFKAVFSTPVTGFTSSGVNLGASTAGGSLSAAVSQIAPNDGTTYDVSVSGMTSGGNVTASIPVNVVNGGNTASTSADNTVAFDNVAPDTALTSNPTNPSPSGSASFGFNGSDPGGTGMSGFQCSLDGAPFTTCTAPKTYSGLSDGSHTFRVRGVDNAGNADPTPAAYTWTVDTTAPDTTLNSNPTNPSNSATGTFTFSGDDGSGSGVSGFECQIDGGGFSACTSPKTYNSLSDGPHTFQVRSRDNAGNADASPASFTWLVDTTAPDTSITGNPTNPSGTNSPSFSFTGSDGGSGVASFECSLDGAPFAPCTSPANLSGLADGNHTFSVRSIDNAGNADATPAAYTWLVDTTAPDTNLTSTPANPSNSSSASFAFNGGDGGGSGVATFECQLDGGGFAACTSPKNYSGLSEGSHTFQVRSKDNSNNYDPTPATFTWVVDTIAPDTAITMNPANPASTGTGMFGFFASDPGGSGISRVECSLDGSAFTNCTSPFNFTGLADGGHTFRARGVDNAGNVDSSPATFTWVVDTVAPDTALTAHPNDPTSSNAPSFSFTGTDVGTGPSSFECQLDGAGFSYCESPKTYNALTDGPHSFEVRTRDGAGNVDPTPASFSWTVDATSPTAVASGPTVTTINGTSYSFTVVYSDNLAVNAQTLGNNDVVVTGPGGFSATATLVDVDHQGNPARRTATYSIVPPGGTWDYFDNGTYTVNLLANSVADTVGNQASAGSIGTFTVEVPPVSIAGNIKQYVPGGVNTNLSGVAVVLSGAGSGSTTTDVNGNYSFTNLPLGGTFVVTPSLSGKIFDPITRTYNSLTTNVVGGGFIAYDLPNGDPRTLKVAQSFGTPGDMIAVPVIVNSQGTESTLSFSLSYDLNPFTGVPAVACGSAAPGCTITVDRSVAGSLGITVTLAAPLAVGSAEVVVVSLQSVPTSLWNSPITFGNSPTAQSMTNSSGDPLPFTDADGWVVFAKGFEGDVGGRNTGDGSLLANDVAMTRLFVVGLQHPDPRFNEFQRADTAPITTKGDGQLDATDIVQTRRYVTGLDGYAQAAGPGANPQGEDTAAQSVEDESANRGMHVVSAQAAPGGRVTVAVEIDPQGDEVASSFTLNFDPTKLKNPQIALGSGAGDATLTSNTENAAGGQLAVVVDSTNVFTGRQLVTITFDVARDARGGETPVTFGDALARRSSSDANGNRLATKYDGGSVTISGAAAAGFEVAGRVVTPDGRCLRNARVTMLDEGGVERSVTTSSFGYYRFDDVAAGGTYTVSVASKQYRFASRTITVTGSLADMDFAGQE